MAELEAFYRNPFSTLGIGEGVLGIALATSSASIEGSTLIPYRNSIKSVPTSSIQADPRLSKALSNRQIFTALGKRAGLAGAIIMTGDIATQVNNGAPATPLVWGAFKDTVAIGAALGAGPVGWVYSGLHIASGFVERDESRDGMYRGEWRSGNR